MFKRIGLFVITNILIIAVISVILAVTGLWNYRGPGGLNYGTLALFSIVVGFAGSFISLAISKWMAKMAYGVQVIDPNGPMTSDERWLVDEVYTLSRDAGLTKMPEVGYYQSPEVNAFATGPSKNNSLVAVSTGLLNTIDRRGVKGVLGHEVAHIANGDMVTMALLQGVINTFVVFLSRVLAFFSSFFVREELRWVVEFILILVFQIIFGILGSMVVMAFSRYREFHADADGARLAGRQNMITALEQLKGTLDAVDNRQPQFATMKISGGRPNWMKLFSSHPDLDERIARLRSMA